MRAWHLDRTGSIDDLRLTGDAPEPTAGAGEVVLAVTLAGLNPADRYLAEGQYPATPAMPHTLGRDGVGTVVAVGSGVGDVRVGDVKAIARGETGVSRPGTFAERVAVRADELIDVPAGWSLEQAAGASLVYLTAYQAIAQWGDLPASGTVLVTGASGGVGVATCQLAKAMGHRVVGLSRDGEKRERLRSLGCDLPLDPADPAWPRAIGGKANLAVDNVGGPGFDAVLGAMAMHGRVSVVGRLAGPVPAFNTASLFFRRLRIGGVAVGSYERAEATAAWAEVLKLLASGGQSPVVDRTFAFEELKEAFAWLKKGPMGKVLVRVA